MAKRYFYVAGDSNKTPVDLSKQTPGTDLISVSPSGEETTFKAGEMFVNSKTFSLDVENNSPDALVEKAASQKPVMLKAAAKKAPTGFMALSAEEKAKVLAAALLKAQAAKAKNPVKAKKTSKSSKPSKS